MSRGVISGDRGGQAVGPSQPNHLFGNAATKKTDEHATPPSVEVQRLVLKLSTAETLLTETQRNKCLQSGKDFIAHYAG